MAEIKPTVISTFAGCGGSSLGYHLAGFKELLAVEWDDNAAATFKLNFPDVPLYHGDIAKLSVEECLARSGLRVGQLDVFDGSPPCQGFSAAGNRKFSDPRNSLFKEYARLLTGLQPKVFVMENVTGMIKGCMKQAYLKIIAELRDCGYQAQGQVLNAMHYNVPQSRERVIIIGVRNDLGLQPSHPKPQTKPIGIETVCPHLKGLKINYCMYPGMVFDGVRPWHSTKEPAPTLSKSGNMAVLENGKLRKFTIKEATLLASFGKEFLFLKDGLQRIGNSVPPNLMKAIALHIKQEILAKAICNL